MPKQNKGRKGFSEKPNTNANNSLDTATDPVDADAIAPNNMATSRAADALENEAATERPEQHPEKSEQQS